MGGDGDWEGKGAAAQLAAWGVLPKKEPFWGAPRYATPGFFEGRLRGNPLCPFSASGGPVAALSPGFAPPTPCAPPLQAAAGPCAEA